MGRVNAFEVRVPGLQPMHREWFFHYYGKHGTPLISSFNAVTSHKLHTFQSNGRDISRIEFVYKDKVIKYFHNKHDGLFGTMIDIKLNPELLTRALNVVNDNMPSLWTSSHREPYRIDLAKLLKLQSREIAVGKDGRRERLAEEKARAQTLIRGLTMDRLINDGIVCVRTVSDYELSKSGGTPLFPPGTPRWRILPAVSRALSDQPPVEADPAKVPPKANLVSAPQGAKQFVLPFDRLLPRK